MSHAETSRTLLQDEALARRVLSRRARQEARMAALLAASARRVHREEAVEATAAHRRCRPRSAPGRDRLSAKQEVADRAQQRAHDARVAQVGEPDARLHHTHHHIRDSSSGDYAIHRPLSRVSMRRSDYSPDIDSISAVDIADY